MIQRATSLLAEDRIYHVINVFYFLSIRDRKKDNKKLLFSPFRFSVDEKYRYYVQLNIHL